MGSFALPDGELTEALLDTFRTELDQREGSFNSDEIWQSWLARDRDDYVQQFSPRAMRRRLCRRHGFIDKVASLKDRFVAGYGEEALIGTLGLGSKCDSLSYDFGTDDNYADSILSLVDNLSRGVAFREFAGLTKQNLARFGLKLRASVYDGSSVRRGVIRRSVIIANAKEVSAYRSGIQQSLLNRLTASANSIIFNVVDHETLEVASNTLLFNIFHPVEGRIRMLMRLGDSGDTATKSKEYWWKQRINNNPFSLAETFALMHGVTVEEMHHAKDRISKMASYIINNQGSASGIDRWLDLTER